jgi:hypothetical protein
LSDLAMSSHSDIATRLAFSRIQFPNGPVTAADGPVLHVLLNEKDTYDE